MTGLPLPTALQRLAPAATLLLLACGGAGYAADAADQTFNLLVFSKTAGFRHGSIAAGTAAVKQLGAEHAFTVDASEDAALFTTETLKKYQAVMFLNTTGHILDDDQRAAFTAFIRAGKGFVGVHSATDTEYEWAWYGKLVGAYFAGHPAPQKATVRVIDHNHPATADVPDAIERKDEWYNFKSLGTDLHILAKLDESTYQGGAMGGDHPIEWYHDYDGGRAFYIEMGHTDESYAEPLYLKQLLGGIEYAAGRKRPAAAK